MLCGPSAAHLHRRESAPYASAARLTLVCSSKRSSAYPVLTSPRSSGVRRVLPRQRRLQRIQIHPPRPFPSPISSLAPPQADHARRAWPANCPALIDTCTSSARRSARPSRSGYTLDRQVRPALPAPASLRNDGFRPHANPRILLPIAPVVKRPPCRCPPLPAAALLLPLPPPPSRHVTGRASPARHLPPPASRRCWASRMDNCTFLVRPQRRRCRRPTRRAGGPAGDEAVVAAGGRWPVQRGHDVIDDVGEAVDRGRVPAER